MPKLKPFIATLADVKISRDGIFARFDYLNQGDRGSQRIEVGKDTTNMSDQELLDIHNHIAARMIESIENYEHIALEIPEGKPQIEFSKISHQWTTNGEVVRCCIGWDENDDGGPMIEVDDKKLSWQEFGALVSTYEGWGMRVTFVPDDELTKIPTVVVGEKRPI